MTRILLLYLLIVAVPTLLYLCFVWWRMRVRNRKDDEAIRAYPADMTARGSHAEAHDFSTTELSYSLDEPEGAVLLHRLTSDRRGTTQYTTDPIDEHKEA